jgi:4,4'-diaponeurosporenoate glycosyltransferase
MTRAYERLSALFNLLAVLGGGLGRDPRRPGVGFGPAMATARSDYLRVGGHESIRAAVVEDQALTSRYADEGLPTEAFAGRADISFRMYPHGVSSIIEGFAKNFASGAGGLPILRLVALVIWVSGLIGTSFSLTWQLGAWAVLGHLPNALAVVGYLAFALQFAIMLRPIGNFGVIAWVMPVPVVFFLAVFLYSMLGWVRGYVMWKGRRIPVRPTTVRHDRSDPES